MSVTAEVAERTLTQIAAGYSPGTVIDMTISTADEAVVRAVLAGRSDADRFSLHVSTTTPEGYVTLHADWPPTEESRRGALG